MTTAIYKIVLPGTSGAAYAVFTDGVLVHFINEWSRFTEPPQYIPIKEGHFNAWATEYHVTPLKSGHTLAEKVALFCIVFREVKGFAYHARKIEKANLKHVTVNRDLLLSYFNTFTFPLTSAKSMEDYVRHYNYVRDMTHNGKPEKSTFPDVYDREYEKRLEPGPLTLYWGHLRKLGWKKADGVWIKETNQ